MSAPSHHSQLASLRSFLNSGTGLKCQCDVCGKTLAKKSNLTRHFRKVHGIDPFPKNLKHKCDYCLQQFNNINQLRYHQRKEHLRFEENDQGGLSQNSETDLVQAFEGESLKEEHNTKSSEVKRHECPLCSESFCRPDFPSHFESKHKLHLQVETLEFDSFSDFMEWKAYMEDETQSNYYKERTSKYGQMNYHYFICNRSGSYKAKGLGVKYLKGQGSCKINAYCPSSIRVQERKDGNCLVTYQKIHVGHKQDISGLYLSIPEAQRTSAKVMTATNLPHSTVSDNIHRDSFPENDTKNLNFQQRKDLHEGENCYVDRYHSSLFNSSFKRKIDGTQNEYYSETSTRENEANYNLSDFINEDSESLTVVDEDSESITVMDDDSESITVIDEDSKSLTAVDEDSESFRSGSEGLEASLPERDENLIREFIEIVKYASTSEEYDVIEKTLVSLKSKVNAARLSAFSMHFSIEKTVRPANMSHEESIFFKNQRNLKNDSLMEPSFVESQNVALSLVLNNGN